MKLKWLGTAGFQVDTGNVVFLIDPYLTRNPASTPGQDLQPKDLSGAAQIFLSHGHFDHLADVPHISAIGNVSVHCSKVAGRTLKRLGVHHGRIVKPTHHGHEFDFGHYRAHAYYSRHARFDVPLMARTLRRINLKALPLLHMHAQYPMGQVLSWRFDIGGYTIQHFGSAGASRSELQRLSCLPLDLLLLPLQGHTHICRIALEYVRILKPRLVIPHHHDDFYPPISDNIDITHFVNGVRQNCPGSDVRVLEINATIEL